MKLPTELIIDVDGLQMHFRYDADPGEDQWFDARAGVGSPGCPPSVMVTEVSLDGVTWNDPEMYPQLNMEVIEQEIMDKLADLEADENAAQAEAEYQAWEESKRLAKEYWK